LTVSIGNQPFALCIAVRLSGDVSLCTLRKMLRLASVYVLLDNIVSLKLPKILCKLVGGLMILILLVTVQYLGKIFV